MKKNNALKRMVLVGSIGFLLGMTPLWAQRKEPQKYKYLIDATNEMMALRREAFMNDPKESGKAILKKACVALSTLLDDREFRKDLDRFAGDQKQYAEARTRLRTDLVEFIDSFIGAEETLFKEAGLTQPAQTKILYGISRFQSAANAPIEPGRILDSLKELQAQICTGAEKIQSSEKFARQIRLWAYGIGGLCTIAIDAAAAPATSAMSTASVSIGAALFGAAVSESLK